MPERLNIGVRHVLALAKQIRIWGIEAATYGACEHGSLTMWPLMGDNDNADIVRW